MKSIPEMQGDVREWISTILPSRDPTKTSIKLVTEAAELLDSISSFGVHPSKSPNEEVADVLILLLDVADQMGIDIEKEFERKMEVNRKRSWHHHNGALIHVT